MRTDVTTAAAALHGQWDRLHGWVGHVTDPELAPVPSVLEGWTVAELWAHLGPLPLEAVVEPGAVLALT